MNRPDLTGHPVALFVFSNLREQKGGLTRAWLRRLSVFHEAGWDTHVATIHPQPEIDETLAAWRGRGWLPEATVVHHYQRRDKRFRPAWSRRTDETFTRDDRVADWLDWLVGRIPGVVVFADSPVTYAPVAMMRNPYVGRIMTVHLAHRKGGSTLGAGAEVGASQRARQIRSRYAGPVGQPRLSGRLLPFAPAADAVVALTGRQAADLREDVPGLEVHVIPNMIDPVRADLVPARDPLRVVQLGRLDSVKRVDHAMRAVGIAVRALPGLHLEVYGRGPELEHLLELRAELGLEQVVSFPGFTEDPIGVLAGSAASIMTSRREGFGLAVAESLAAGTPVVTYDVDYGPAELVEDGVNGRVVADGSIEQLATALVDVLSDAQVWRRMSLAAPAAAERLRPEVVADQWLGLADEVARRVELPISTFLVEDLRVHREGLVVEGVAIGASEEVLVHRVAVPGGVEVPLERGQELSPRDAPPGHPSPMVRDVRATLPWSAVERWPIDSSLGASDALGRPVPLAAPGVPVTVAPTEDGPRLLSASPSGGLACLAPSIPVMVDLTAAGPQADIGQDATMLTEVLEVHCSVMGRAGTDVECVVHPRGLQLEAPVEMLLVVRVSERAVPVGRVRSIAGSGAWTDSRWTFPGRVEWDPAALSELSGLLSTAAVVGLAAGRSSRSLGPVTMEGGRPIALAVGGHWLLAPARSGRLLLVPGRGLRTRAAWVARGLGRRLRRS